jgi:hypothetical protein
MKQFFKTILPITAVVILLSALTVRTSNAAGINQKGLGVNLTFQNLVGDQPNFDLQGFTVDAQGSLVADVIITWRSGDQALASTEIMLPVLAVSGGCDGLSIQIDGAQVNLLGLSLGFDGVSFDIYAGDLTPTPVRRLLCTAGHLADAGVNGRGMAGALNRILPALQ